MIDHLVTVFKMFFVIILTSEYTGIDQNFSYDLTLLDHFLKMIMIDLSFKKLDRYSLRIKNL